MAKKPTKTQATDKVVPVELSAADKFYIENNRNISADSLCQAIGKPIKLIADYIGTLPELDNDFKVQHNEKVRTVDKTLTHQQMTTTENATVNTERSAELMSECLKNTGRSFKLDNAIHRIRPGK